MKQNRHCLLETVSIGCEVLQADMRDWICARLDRLLWVDWLPVIPHVFVLLL